MNKEKYLVAYIIRKTEDVAGYQEHGLEDMFLTCDTMEEAQKAYDNILLWDNLYSCNICKVIKSTDY